MFYQVHIRGHEPFIEVGENPEHVRKMVCFQREIEPEDIVDVIPVEIAPREQRTFRDPQPDSRKRQLKLF